MDNNDDCNANNDDRPKLVNNLNLPILSATATTEVDNMLIHSSVLLKGLDSLRRANQLFDVTLVAEGRRFRAHRNVLAACSDYFCAMFTDGMIEAGKEEIDLKGVSARGIATLIDYAYTAEMELNNDNIQEVLAASTYIQMATVIELCAKFLESKLDFENCAAIASLSELYELNVLKKKAYRFISARFAELAETPDLYSLKWQQLETMLTMDCPTDCVELRLLSIVLMFCMKKEVSFENTRRILAQIRFLDIPKTVMESLLYRQKRILTVNSEIVKFNFPCIYYDTVQDEWVRQRIMHNDQQLSKYDNQSDVYKLLRNPRGLQLALLKIGGFETNGLTNEIRCLIPAKGKWKKLTAIPHVDQCNYGSAVMANYLFVVGGSYDVCLKEYIHPFGFRYCPTTNKWVSIAPIQADRCRFSLNALGNNHLYAVGGVFEVTEDENLVSNDTHASNCERYNNETDAWEYIARLPESRSQHAGVALGDLLYISGGIDRNVVLASLWCLDTKTLIWKKLAPMPTARCDHTLIATSNHIYACGGWYEDSMDETRTLAEFIDVYSIELDQWSVEARHPLPKYYAGIAALDRKIFFIGGLMSNPTINRASAATECYDLDTKKWSCNSDWSYPQEVWECACAAMYVPIESVGDDADVEIDNGNEPNNDDKEEIQN